MTSFDFDLVVIAEEYRVGGTCVIRGCVPKKLLVYASRFHGEFEDAKGFGWTLPEPSFDWPTLIANKDKEIDRLEAAYRSTLARWKVETIESRAVVTGPQTVKFLKTGREVRAGKILIATGGYPDTDAKIPGHELAITSNDAFHLKQLPKSILIAGGGYIAAEFAGIFAGLGVETTLIYRGPQILRGFDQDLRDDVTAAMIKRGVNIVTNQTIKSIGRSGTALAATLSGGTAHNYDQIMYAIGRKPNTHDLGLESAGVTLTETSPIA